MLPERKKNVTVKCFIKTTTEKLSALFTSLFKVNLYAVIVIKYNINQLFLKNVLMKT